MGLDRGTKRVSGSLSSRGPFPIEARMGDLFVRMGFDEALAHYVERCVFEIASLCLVDRHTAGRQVTAPIGEVPSGATQSW